MDANTIITVISTVGFPIVMCGAIAWYVKYVTDKHREEVNNLNEQHKKEMEEITTAINNNTIALTKLCERMERDEN